MNINCELTSPRTELISEAVLYVLSYYAVFNYPLKTREIVGNCSVLCSEKEIESCLAELCANGKVFSLDGYFSVSPDIDYILQRRLDANQLALKKIKKAQYAGRVIALFPFVRFVGISGSLSKGYADARSDFDFFIITAANRLWLCRTMLHLFKKLTFLFGQQHKFCMNYFIDLSQYRLEEQNIYTAIELSGLVPVAGKKTYNELMYANRDWIKNLLPNGYQNFYSPDYVSDGTNMLKSAAEFFFHPVGMVLNNFLMQITDYRWRKKWRRKNYPAADYDLAFKTTLHHSKNHPANFQKKILSQLKHHNGTDRI